MSLRTTLGHGALPLALLCSLTAAEAADIRIAVVASLTGPNASAGDQVRRGAELAAEDINAAGGVSPSTPRAMPRAWPATSTSGTPSCGDQVSGE